MHKLKQHSFFCITVSAYDKKPQQRSREFEAGSSSSIGGALHHHHGGGGAAYTPGGGGGPQSAGGGGPHANSQLGFTGPGQRHDHPPIE